MGKTRQDQNHTVILMSEPLIMSSDTAFRQLRDKGEVTSVRKGEYDVKDVWIRRTRTGPKEFDAAIAVAGKYPWSQMDTLKKLLQIFVDKSGFDSVDDWIAEIREKHGEIPQPVTIIMVDRESGNYA